MNTDLRTRSIPADRIPATGGLAKVALLSWALLGAFVGVDSGSSQTLACKPCAGIRVEDPRTLISELETSPHLDEEAILFVAVFISRPRRIVIPWNCVLILAKRL